MHVVRSELNWNSLKPIKYYWIQDTLGLYNVQSWLLAHTYRLYSANLKMSKNASNIQVKDVFPFLVYVYLKCIIMFWRVFAEVKDSWIYYYIGVSNCDSIKYEWKLIKKNWMWQTSLWSELNLIQFSWWTFYGLTS